MPLLKNCEVDVVCCNVSFVCGRTCSKNGQLRQVRRVLKRPSGDWRSQRSQLYWQIDLLKDEPTLQLDDTTGEALQGRTELRVGDRIAA